MSDRDILFHFVCVSAILCILLPPLNVWNVGQYCNVYIVVMKCYYNCHVNHESFFCIYCPSKLEAEMPRYRLYTHEKNGMRRFINVGKWNFRQLGIPQETLLMTKLFARPAINIYNVLALEKSLVNHLTREVSITIFCLQQSKFISAIQKTKKDSCCKRAIS